MITGFPPAPKGRKKIAGTLERPRWPQPACLQNRPVHLCMLHPSAKTPGTRADGRTTFAPLLSLQRQCWSRRWVLRPPGTRICVPVFHVCCCEFRFFWHLPDPTAPEELGTCCGGRGQAWGSRDTRACTARRKTLLPSPSRARAIT